MVELKINELVKQVRIHKKLSQTEFAESHGRKTHMSVYKWEKDSKFVPKDVLLQSLQYFKKNISESVNIIM